MARPAPPAALQVVALPVVRDGAAGQPDEGPDGGREPRPRRCRTGPRLGPDAAVCEAAAQVAFLVGGKEIDPPLFFYLFLLKKCSIPSEQYVMGAVY